MASDGAGFARAARRVAQAPADGYAAAELARLALSCGREAEAAPLVAQAASVIAASAVLHQWAGVLARAIGDSETAFTHFGAAARIAPTDVRIAQGCALSALEAGWPAAALFDRALRLAPLDEVGLLGRAAARLADGEPALAIREIDGVLADNPGWLGGHQRSAQLHHMMGAAAGATASLDRALAAAPRDPGLWQLLLRIKLDARDFAGVLDAVARARAAVGAHADFDLSAATAMSELGDLAGAGRLFDAAPGPLAVGWRIRALRHQLRSGRIEAAAVAAENELAGDAAHAFWPYVALCWRLTDRDRSDWLERQPGLIAVFSLDLDLRDLANRLRTLHERNVRYFEQSVRGGTQTDGPLFARVDPAIAALHRACSAAVERYIAALPPVDAAHPVLGVRRDRPVRFAGSWSVRLTDGGFHAAHIHPEGWLSSAFYVAVPGSGGDDAGWLDLGAAPPELGLDVPPQASICPVPGQLVLFPSTMWHATRPFAAGERLTVAFDVARPDGAC